ncbi:hypothetical protein K492DRAFT_207970 [Lichtheimia hyalospora FSU 10163]|nr:hypothetical protein K492DRAFT_207970 [Lichtheimia hyalospora FSU 10163]
MLTDNNPSGNPSSSIDSRHHFHPVILFHDYEQEKHKSVSYGDPYYRPLIQIKKEQMDKMLKVNSQWWKYITQSPHTLLNNNDNNHHDMQDAMVVDNSHNNNGSGSSSSPRLSSSTSTASSSSSPSIPPSPPFQHRQSLSQQQSQRSGQDCYYEKHRKRRGNLPKSVTAILKQWLIDHCQHPYPTEDEKMALRNRTGLTLNQISNWFINARRRILPLILVRLQPPPSSSTSSSSSSSAAHHHHHHHPSTSSYSSSPINSSNTTSSAILSSCSRRPNKRRRSHDWHHQQGSV